MNEIFVELKDYPNYEFSNMDRFRNKLTGNFMTLNKDKRFCMYKDGKRKTVSLNVLKEKYYDPNYEEELFVSIHNDSYEISNKGRIFDNENMQYLEPYLKEGEPSITLNINNRKKTFSVKKLIKKYFS